MSTTSDTLRETLLCHQRATRFASRSYVKKAAIQKLYDCFLTINVICKEEILYFHVDLLYNRDEKQLGGIFI